MRNANLAAMIAVTSIGAGLLAQAHSDSAGFVHPKSQPKRKPFVHTQRLEQDEGVQAWNAAVQAKRDAKLARRGRP